MRGSRHRPIPVPFHSSSSPLRPTTRLRRPSAPAPARQQEQRVPPSVPSAARLCVGRAPPPGRASTGFAPRRILHAPNRSRARESASRLPEAGSVSCVSGCAIGGPGNGPSIFLQRRCKGARREGRWIGEVQGRPWQRHSLRPTPTYRLRYRRAAGHPAPMLRAGPPRHGERPRAVSLISRPGLPGRFALSASPAARRRSRVRRAGCSGGRGAAAGGRVRGGLLRQRFRIAALRGEGARPGNCPRANRRGSGRGCTRAGPDSRRSVG